MSDNRPAIGSRIRVTVQCDSDCRNEGMGIQCYANNGEELIVRGHSPYSEQTIYVAHERITDQSFSVDEGEYEVVSAAIAQAGAGNG